MPRHPPCALSNLTLRQAHSAMLSSRPRAGRGLTPSSGPRRLGTHTCSQEIFEDLQSQCSVVKVPLRRAGAGPRTPKRRADDTNEAPPMGRLVPPARRADSALLDRCACVLPRKADRQVVWWSRGDSNPRPPPCKGGALPVELRPQMVRAARPRVGACGGPSWTRTRDLSLIRTAL